MTLGDLLSKQEGCFHEMQVGTGSEISLGKNLHMLHSHPDSVMVKNHQVKPGIR